MSVWKGKPCQRCGNRKGPKSLQLKFCFACGRIERREASNRTHRARVARTYGIEPGDYDRLYEAQRGKCAICRVATGRTRRLTVDHDHATGEVRGLLCRPCNNLLGFARDDPMFFERGRQYLLSPPARFVLTPQE